MILAASTGGIGLLGWGPDPGLLISFGLLVFVYLILVRENRKRKRAYPGYPSSLSG